MISLSDTIVGRDFSAVVHVYNGSTQDVGEQARRSVRQLLDQQYERQIAESFVPPDGWKRAVSTLRERHIVLLNVAPGSGRRTAAVCLLGTHSHEESWIQELSAEPEQGEGALDNYHVAENERLLLDLSTVGDDQFRAAQRQLLQLRGTVRDRNAVLVVVVPRGREREVRAEFTDLLVRLERPDGTAVFHRHLARHDVDHPLPARPELCEVLERSPMKDITHLAWLVREARERATTTTTFDAWLDEAIAAHRRRADEAAAQIARQSGRGRGLMLAASLLERFPADEVFEAHRLLLRILGYPAPEAHELDEPDLRTSLDEIDVEVGPDRRVQFRKLNYAEAVLRHFWANFPGQRDRFRMWVVECGRRMRCPAGQADDFVGRFVDACLEANRSTDVIRALEAWTRDEPLSLAQSALEKGLTDPRGAWRFRRRCYEWSVDYGMRASLAQIVIAASVEVIAPTHPQQAIVRLHHLARNRDDDVAATARAALVGLAEDRRVLRVLLSRLVDRERRRLEYPRDRSLFLTAAHPGRLLGEAGGGRPLLAESGVRCDVVRGWRLVFRHGGKAEYGAFVQRWLDTHVAHRQDELLHVLVEACNAEFATSAALSSLAGVWLRNSDDEAGAAQRRDTARKLFCAIDHARPPIPLRELPTNEGRP